jgi:hypothetical protein
MLAKKELLLLTMLALYGERGEALLRRLLWELEEKAKGGDHGSPPTRDS